MATGAPPRSRAPAARPALTRAEVPPPEAGPLPPRWDAVTVLSWYSVALLLIPASLIVHPLGASGTPAMILGALMLLWWALSRMLPELGSAHGLQPVRWALLCFTVSVLLSYLAMAMHYRLPVEVSGANRGILKLLGWSGVALVAADGIRDRARLDKLLERLVWLAAAMAAIGMIQFFFGFDIAARIRIPGLRLNEELTSLAERSVFRRVGGTASHPIEFGVVLAAVLPLALHFTFGRGAAGRVRSLWARQRDWVCLALVGVGAPLAVSRSATLGLAVVLVVVFAGWPARWRVQGLMWMPLVLVGLRLAIPGLLGTIAALFSSFDSDPSISGRTDDYSEVADWFARAPWVGHGFTTFLPVLYRTLDNQYLLQLVEGGVIGVLAMLGLFLVGWCCARGARWRGTDLAQRNLAQALAASIACLAMTFGTFDALSFPMVSALLFLLLGCCGTLWRLAREETREETGPGREGGPSSPPG